MAPSITKAVTENFDPNVTDSSGGAALLGAAQASDPEAARYLSPRPFTFSIEGVTSAADAGIVANAFVRLGVSGVLFPADSFRRIITRTWSRRAIATPTDSGYVEKIIYVAGAATPTVKQDTTGALSAATAIPVAFLNNATDLTLPFAVGEVGGVFLVMQNVATTALQTAIVSGGNGVRWRCEVTVDTLVQQVGT